MIKFTMSVMVLGLALSYSSAFATVTKAKKAELPKLDTKSDLLLQVEGKIFPQDAFPDSCKNLLQGGKCEATSYGSCVLESKKDKDMVYNHSVFTGPEGDQQIEESWEKNGHVLKASIKNTILQKLLEMEVKDGKVYYQVTDLQDHSVKKSNEKADENLVMPSTIMSYIRPFADQIAKGEKVQVKIAVIERFESFTFNIKKIRDEKTLDGEPVQVLEMKPASIIVSALVSPMYFHIKTKTGEMFAFEGESAVRRKVGDSWKKMQVYTAYHYKVNVAGNGAESEKTGCDPTANFDGKNPEKCEIKQ